VAFSSQIFLERIAVPGVRPAGDARLVVFCGQDGYRASMPLEDLLRGDVLLADRLNGLPLTLEHGAPIRLIAPAHYGYKNVKHLSRIEFHRNDRTYRPAGYRFMDHPRFVRPMISRFHQAMLKDVSRRGATRM
jgi:DMSO/TMAO reductase YedYZ molybdopterin-dependent catalytic subunit